MKHSDTKEAVLRSLPVENQAQVAPTPEHAFVSALRAGLIGQQTLPVDQDGQRAQATLLDQTTQWLGQIDSAWLLTPSVFIDDFDATRYQRLLDCSPESAERIAQHPLLMPIEAACYRDLSEHVIMSILEHMPTDEAVIQPILRSFQSQKRPLFNIWVALLYVTDHFLEDDLSEVCGGSGWWVSMNHKTENGQTVLMSLLDHSSVSCHYLLERICEVSGSVWDITQGHDSKCLDPNQLSDDGRLPLIQAIKCWPDDEARRVRHSKDPLGQLLAYADAHLDVNRVSGDENNDTALRYALRHLKLGALFYFVHGHCAGTLGDMLGAPSDMVALGWCEEGIVWQGCLVAGEAEWDILTAALRQYAVDNPPPDGCQPDVRPLDDPLVKLCLRLWDMQLFRIFPSWEEIRSRMGWDNREPDHVAAIMRFFLCRALGGEHAAHWHRVSFMDRAWYVAQPAVAHKLQRYGPASYQDDGFAQDVADMGREDRHHLYRLFP